MAQRNDNGLIDWLSRLPWWARRRLLDSQPDAPTCHVCSRPMVQRVERHGFRRGAAFWACSGHPHCKGNRPLREAV